LGTTRKLAALIASAAMFFVACAGGGSPSPSAASQPPASEPASPSASASVAPSVEPIDFSACMVSDTGGIDDNSFNENAWKGMQDAQAQLGVEVKFLESESDADYARNIDQFISEDCDMIVTVGFLLGDATKAGAEANPDTRFAIVDFAYDPALPNVEGLVFSTSEAAMLAGYASASWSKSDIMGTFGGIDIGAPVTDFMSGFVAGANYWNQESGESVRVLGWDPVAKTGSFTGNFESIDDAKRLSEGFLQEGADVILPVGGPIGEGTFVAIEESGAEATGLGVDVDWTQTLPDYSEYMLTHILKKIDVAVFSAVERAVNDEAPQPVFVSTLENGGVDIGPFHDYDSEITAEVKAGIETLREAIISGDVAVDDYFAAQ
jgi:basic membrane protein A and related proteins